MSSFDFSAEYKLILDEFQIEAAAVLLEIAKKNAPKGLTGDFAKSLYPVVIGVGESITFEIRSDSKKPDPVWLSEGTHPHTIEAVAAKALAWQSLTGGTVIFARSVMHPGSKASDWEDRTVIEATTALEALLETKLAKFYD